MSIFACNIVAAYSGAELLSCNKPYHFQLIHHELKVFHVLIRLMDP